MTTPEEIKAEYASSLSDLTFNSKPLINVLTMLADENSPNAKVIVEAIETHLSKVATDVKLPILYLIDCIVKNVGGTYTTLFSQNIVSTFCGVFKSVDEKTRAEMFKLRLTWNDVFPQMKLYAIDVQIRMLDPAWPVTAKPPSSSIHFNPKFLKTTTTTTKPSPEIESSQVITPAVPGNIDKETLLMQEKLIQKQKELLELQQKKLELEVLQTQVKLQEQIKNNVPLPVRPQNILLKPEVAKQLVPSALKNKPVIHNPTTLIQQTGVNNGQRTNTFNTLPSSKPIRDPRLLRQQQKTNNSNVHLGQKTAVLESNKIVKTSIRKIRNDPRLLNKDNNILSQKVDNKSSNLSKTRSSDMQKSYKTSRVSPKIGSSDSNSTKSSSCSSLDSPSKSDKSSKPPTKHKKKEKSDDKKNDLKDQNRDKLCKVTSPTTSKSVKSSTKNRNYVRHNVGALIPEPPQDEDLRSFGPPEKQPRLQGDSSDGQNNTVASSTKGVDIDLRQLPAVIGKKRSSTEITEGSAKKTKTEIFDKLFGDEDTDLRQLPVTTDRPPTPPPPIISSSETVIEKIESPKSNFDAVRAKLANATNKGKMMKSFNKKKLYTLEDQDLRIPKLPPTEISNKIIISPEDENGIKSGTLTKEQEAQLLNKIILQMEKNKLKEAKKKDHEESFNVSLQPISDDDLSDMDENNEHIKNKTENDDPIESVIPFNDKDERFRPAHILSKPDYIPPYFHQRDIRRPPAPQNWRGGGRGTRRHWENQVIAHPRVPGRSWNPVNSWRNVAPNFPPQRDFLPISHSLQEEELPENPDISGDQLTNGAVNQDEIKTINIDGMPKDIRFYDETAVAFINWDDPREISFQDGVRHVIFNDKDSYLLGFNKPYQEVLINGSPHKIRLGAPSREIFIDHVPYECYFGSAGIRIDLNGVSTTVKLEGPPPQVKIGEVRRTDLVAGKINLFINAKVIVPVFLDAKVQKFMIDGQTSTLKFVNALQTVLINDIPFSVEYGGLPKPIYIHDKKHFIRFSVLPKGTKPGHVTIRDMESEGNITPKGEDSNQGDTLSTVDTAEPAIPVISKLIRPSSRNSPERDSNSPNFFQNLLQQQNLNNLDVLSNVMTPSAAPTPTTGGYQIENIQSNDDNSLNQSKINIAPAPQPLNINDLFQKLVASGFVTSGNNAKPSTLPIPEARGVKKDTQGELQKTSSQISDSNQAAVKIVKRNNLESIKLISFAKPETLKLRQRALYNSLYAGMQCSSCGMRFSPEASMQYSQHLDWHFRQNRKGKRNIRVATSRKWYYTLSDWKNYEELEDLEEREKNYFDQQQQAENIGDETEEEVEIPSVPADPETTDECCDVCSDKFDQFFNEEREEWHLRNAIRIEDKTYHPVCYNDYQQSLAEQTFDESKVEPPTEEENTVKSPIPGLEIIIDDDDVETEKDGFETAEVVSLESDESKSQNEPTKEEYQEGEDDDVILNEIAPIKIVVDDDDDENQENSQDDQDAIRIKEEKLDDGFLEVAGLVSLQDGGQIKIKAEPVDPDEAVQNQMEIENQNTTSTQSKPQSEQQDLVSTQLHPELVTSIDGNVEIISGTTSTVTNTGVGSNKIKINISKPLPVIPSKEKEVPSESEFSTDTYIDSSEPFPPGEEPEPVKLKPALQGVKLKKLPLVKKGNELSGLCSIM